MSGVHPYIQALIDAGDVVVYFDPRSGSYRDWSGNGNDVIPTAPTRLGLFGANLNNTGRMGIAGDASLDIGSGAYSLVYYFPDGYAYNTSGTNYAWGQAVGNGGIHFLLGSVSAVLQQRGVNSGINITPIGRRAVACSLEPGQLPSFFYDGVFEGLGASILTATDPAILSVTIGTPSSYIRQIPTPFGAVLATSRALTATEHALVYDALEHTTWPRLTYSHAPPKGLDVCDDPGIIAAYNMRPVGGKVYDLSGNGNDGTVRRAVYEKTPLGDALRFDGTNDVSQVSIPYDPSMNVTAGLSASCWVRTTGLSGTLITRWHTTGDNLCWGMYIAGGVLRFAASGDGTVSDLDTANDGTLINDGLLRHLAITYDVPTKTVSFFIDGEFSSSAALTHSGPLYPSSQAELWLADEQTGNLGDNYDGPMTAPIIRNYAMTPDEIKAEYNRGAEALLFKTDWGARETAAPVTAGLVGGSPWEAISGSFDVVTVDYKGEPHKALKCISAGVCAIPTSAFRVGPTQAARGGFKWIMSKAALGNTAPNIAFIGNQKSAFTDSTFNGYSYQFAPNESVRVGLYTNGVISYAGITVADAVLVDTFYECAVDVTAGGDFYSYLNGELVDLTGGSGTNPFNNTAVTESKFALASFGAGDMILLGNRNGENGFQKLLGVPK